MFKFCLFYDVIHLHTFNFFVEVHFFQFTAITLKEFFFVETVTMHQHKTHFLPSAEKHTFNFNFWNFQIGNVVDEMEN